MVSGKHTSLHPDDIERSVLKLRPRSQRLSGEQIALLRRIISEDWSLGPHINVGYSHEAGFGKCPILGISVGDYIPKILVMFN